LLQLNLASKSRHAAADRGENREWLPQSQPQSLARVSGDVRWGQRRKCGAHFVQHCCRTQEPQATRCNWLPNVSITAPDYQLPAEIGA